LLLTAHIILGTDGLTRMLPGKAGMVNAVKVHEAATASAITAARGVARKRNKNI